MNTSDNLICVKNLVPFQSKHWKLESEKNSVCYRESDVLGQPNNDPEMDNEIVCTNYKHLIDAYHQYVV